MGFYVWLMLLGIFFATWIAFGGIGMLGYVVQRCRKGNVEWICNFLWWLTASVMLFKKGCGHKLETAFAVLFSPAAVFSGLLLLSVWLVESPYKMAFMDNVPVVGKQINRWALKKSTGLDFPLFDVEDFQFQDYYPDYTIKVKLVFEDSPSKKKILDTIKNNIGSRLEIAGEEFSWNEELWVDDKGNLFYIYNVM